MRDLDGHRQIVGAEVHVEGDEGLSCTDRDGTASRMDAQWPEIRGAMRHGRDLVADRLVLAAPDLCQALALGTEGGIAVQVYRDVESARDLLAEATRQVDALLDPGESERNEGDDINRTDARVGALVLRHVDELEGATHRGRRRPDHRLGAARERDHTAIVGHVAGVIEHGHAVDRRDGMHDLLDHFAAPSFAEVRHAFNQSRHVQIVAAPVADCRTPRRDWYAPNHGRHLSVSGRLFVVAVPIGNPDDVTLRAIATLSAVGVVAAEDTRHFRTLARRHGIATPAVSYHDHNEEGRARELVARLLAGEDVALVSDAGTPLVSDPGYRLVRAALEAGVEVTSLPGASAVTTALAASGLPPHPFRFIGFLPRTSAARRSALAALRDDPATLIAFEAPRRLLATLGDVLSVLGDRPACLARSITKSHENYQRASVAALIDGLEREGDIRGECTLLVGGALDRSPSVEAATADANLLLSHDTPSRAVQELLIQRHGLSKRDAYALVLAARGR